MRGVATFPSGPSPDVLGSVITRREAWPVVRVQFVPLGLLLLSGCTQTGPAGPFVAQHEETSASHPEYPGLVLEGRIEGGGWEVRSDAAARNSGDHTYRVRSICREAWSESMSGPSGRVYPREPMAYCEAFGLRSFPPGDRIPFAPSWNGTLWDAEASVRAPAGAYEWRLTFEVFRGGEDSEFEDRDYVHLDFEVKVR